MKPTPIVTPDRPDDGTVAAGGCACGAVRFRATGHPAHTGLCHCLTCQRRHAAPFNAFVTFAAGQVTIEGPTSRWRSSPTACRESCARCGSPISWRDDAGEYIELHAAGFDAPDRFAPQSEIWTLRRVDWLDALDVPQYERDPP